MRIHERHAWNVSAQEAIRLQKQWVASLEHCPLPKTVKMVAGADVSYNIGSRQMYAGVVVVHLPKLQVVEEQVAVGLTDFPYVTGLLSFREAPMLIEAFRQVGTHPEVVMFDGQGIAHPRRMGIAAHLGLFLEVPTVGCAKSWLTGRYDEHALSPTAGASVPLCDATGSEIGAVVRTKARTRPVFVSPGHLADVRSAVTIVLQCCAGYKLPEPTRLAHLLVNRVRKEQRRS
jgi:deoxyribonuclease V